MKNFPLFTQRNDDAFAMPILAFPAAPLLGLVVSEMLSSPENQSRAVAAAAKRTPSLAALMFMDLSVEAEAFGAKVEFGANEIPNVEGALLSGVSDVENLEVPQVGAGRTGVCVESARSVKRLVSDRPLLAGCIGPFTLAGRLFGVTEIMMFCLDEPEAAKMLLDKTTLFISNYVKSLSEAGADGVLLAEPLAGLLSPAMNAEFSVPYVKRIAASSMRDGFFFIYHNCGGGVVPMAADIFSIGASAYHFGNAIDIVDMLKAAPKETVIMGNIDPSSQFLHGSAQGVYRETADLLGRAGKYENFILSSGCDIPAAAKWENIDAFYRAAADYYGKI